MSERKHDKITGSRGRPIVRVKAIGLGIILSLPVAYGLSLILPKESDQTKGHQVAGPQQPAYSTSFNGNGPINMTSKGIAIKGYDVVAYFTESKPVKGSKAFEAEYKEATFRFASEENRQQFLDNREKYVPAYGGFCAVGIANGYKDDMHPEAFAVFNGRLYFNLSPSIQQAWQRNKQAWIAEANANWPSLKEAPGYGPADAR